MGRMVSLLVVVSAVVVLSGCASASPNPAPPRAVASTAPTPAPTQTPSGTPGWPYGIGCEDLLSSSTVQSHIVDAVTVKYDQHSVPVTASDVALADAGALRCVWGGAYRTDSSYDDGLTLTVLPDAAAEYASWVASGGSPGCTSNPCTDGGRLAGTTWFSLSLSDSTRPGGNSANLSADDTVLAAQVTDALAHLGPRGPAWIPPATAADGKRFCQPGEATRLANVFAVDPLKISFDDHPDPTANDLRSVAVGRGGLARCNWTIGDGQVVITTVPGGAWASTRMVTSPQSYYPIGQTSAVTIAGTSDAVAGCGDGCEATFSIGDSLYAIYAQTMDLQTFLPQVERFVSSMPS